MKDFYFYFGFVCFFGFGILILKDIYVNSLPIEIISVYGVAFVVGITSILFKKILKNALSNT